MIIQYKASMKQGVPVTTNSVSRVYYPVVTSTKAKAEIVVFWAKQIPDFKSNITLTPSLTKVRNSKYSTKTYRKTIYMSNKGCKGH